MFKKALLSFAMVAFSGSVLAAPTANIYVKGKIGAPTCTINGQDTADIVYSYDIDLNNAEVLGEFYYLEEQKQRLNIQCDTATVLSFNVLDARLESIDEILGRKVFGLGTHGEKNIGFYTMSLNDIRVKETLDAEEQTAGVIVNGNFTTGSLESPRIFNNDNVSWVMNDNFAIAQSFSADILVNPAINIDLKDVAEEVELDGLAILSFSFGI